MSLSITTRTSAAPAQDGQRCGGLLRTYYSDDYSDKPCDALAVWVITIETEHDEPTPEQARMEKSGWRKASQRRFVTRRAYCVGCIPKRHRYAGLNLGRRPQSNPEQAIAIMEGLTK